jgi:hypothetical protein
VGGEREREQFDLLIHVAVLFRIVSSESDATWNIPCISIKALNDFAEA